MFCIGSNPVAPTKIKPFSLARRVFLSLGARDENLRASRLFRFPSGPVLSALRASDDGAFQQRMASRNRVIDGNRLSVYTFFTITGK